MSMSATLKPMRPVESIKNRLCVTTLKTINKSTACADRAEKAMKNQEEKIEKCRRSFLRRHETLTRIVEKDLKNLQTARRKVEEERQRRITYCISLKNEKTSELYKTSRREADCLHSGLSRQEKLLFGTGISGYWGKKERKPTANVVGKKTSRTQPPILSEIAIQ